VLDSTEHVLIVKIPGVQVIKGFELISMLEVVGAFFGTMIFEDDEFLALMFGEFALKLQLLLGEIERFTYC